MQGKNAQLVENSLLTRRVVHRQQQTLNLPKTFFLFSGNYLLALRHSTWFIENEIGEVFVGSREGAITYLSTSFSFSFSSSSSPPSHNNTDVQRLEFRGRIRRTLSDKQSLTLLNSSSARSKSDFSWRRKKWTVTSEYYRSSLPSQWLNVSGKKGFWWSFSNSFIRYCSLLRRALWYCIHSFVFYLIVSHFTFASLNFIESSSR